MYDPSEAAAHAAEAARDRQDEANKARAKAAMDGDIIVADRPAPNHYAPTKLANGASEASINRLVRSSRVMYGDQPTEATVREWAAGQTQRAVSDRISAIEAMPGFQAKRAAASAQKPAQRGNGGFLRQLGEQGLALRLTNKDTDDGKRRYAVEHDGQLRFYRVDVVDEGRWAGYTFMKEGVGGAHDGDLVWHRMDGKRREAASKAILDAGLAEAAKLYGQHIGECGDCGRSLTDKTSRDIGIGPVCRSYRGW